jgi:hypothetical protein
MPHREKATISDDLGRRSRDFVASIEIASETDDKARCATPQKRARHTTHPRISCNTL